MKKYHHSHPIRIIILTLIVVVIAIAYIYYRLHIKIQTLKKNEIAFTTENTVQQSRINSLSNDLDLAQHTNKELIEALRVQEQKLQETTEALVKVSTNLGTLEKLNKIDKELLQKYSKVYFLNEHYTPSSLSTIASEFVSTKGKVLHIHTQVSPRLDSLLKKSTEAGLSLRIASAYRSYATQSQLKSNNKIIYGTTAANRFSADQGYSEHQLGTTVDITTAKTSDLSASFEKTPEFIWLTEHAHDYGFVLSYPKNNKYYIYEPWHWRYVGLDLAKKLYDDKKYLYDLDQREIDGYLGSIFD